MQNIERFVVLMYSKRCGLAKDNEARYYLCTTGRRPLENIPCTQAAPFQHIKRALQQASFYCNQAISQFQEMPDFGEWGWHRDDSGTWMPYWTSLADASNVCSILLHCGCIASCTRNCKCTRVRVNCTRVQV